MELVNLSAEPLGRLHSWVPHDLTAEKVVFLPDACPGKSPLPTGTAVLTHQSNWRRFAVSDCGCGMSLVRSTVDARDLDAARWNKVADSLRANKGGLGDWAGGIIFSMPLFRIRMDHFIFSFTLGPAMNPDTSII
jgi:hypothetical protein